jgi:uncharacterized membrane protein YeaQ/YmgE (transglycosylase-associated protein family)
LATNLLQIVNDARRQQTCVAYIAPVSMAGPRRCSPCGAIRYLGGILGCRAHQGGPDARGTGSAHPGSRGIDAERPGVARTSADREVLSPRRDRREHIIACGGVSEYRDRERSSKGGCGMTISLIDLLIYLVIAAIAAIIAERIVGAGPYGIIGTIILGVVGIFMMVNLLHFVIPGDPVIGGVPILTAILGAIIVDALYLAVMRGTRRRL